MHLNEKRSVYRDKDERVPRKLTFLFDSEKNRDSRRCRVISRLCHSRENLFKQ